MSAAHDAAIDLGSVGGRLLKPQQASGPEYEVVCALLSITGVGFLMGIVVVHVRYLASLE